MLRNLTRPAPILPQWLNLRVTPLLAGAVALLALAQPGLAQTPPPTPDDAGLYVVIEAAQRQIDGMLVLQPVCQGLPKASCETIETVLGNDTRLSGILRWLKTSGGLHSSAVKTGMPNLVIRPGGATGAGATYVLGSLLRSAKEPGLVELQVTLFNALTNKPIDLGDAGQQVAPASSLRSMAHRVMNAVQGAITGVEGTFDTVIFYSAPAPGCSRAIWQVDADGYNRRVLVSDGGKQGVHMFPIQLVDGGLAYMSFRTGDPSLFKMDAAQLSMLSDLTPTLGRKEKLKKNGPAAPQADIDRTFVPIAFAKGSIDRQFRSCAQNPRGDVIATINDGDQADIWTLDYTGTPLRNLTHADSDELSPVYSPDGNWIAYVSNRTDQPHVYVMDTTGGQSRRLTWVGPYNTDPDWGPDGRIAYSGMRGSAIDILTVDLQGHAQRLTPGQGKRSLEPSWAPDGKRLVYASNEDGKCMRLWITAADGASREPMDVPCGDYSTPSWQRIPGKVPKRWISRQTGG